MDKLTGAERVRARRARRRNHGMVEIRVWVKAADKNAALEAVKPFQQAARRYMEQCTSLGWEKASQVPHWYLFK